ncbi:MAG: hypothetical protein IPP29_21150 [Bacteroidetes bacterium]|nr:hypothetical protein [Bacteroidota bacterium]
MSQPIQFAADDARATFAPANTLGVACTTNYNAGVIGCGIPAPDLLRDNFFAPRTWFYPKANLAIIATNTNVTATSTNICWEFTITNFTPAIDAWKYGAALNVHFPLSAFPTNLQTSLSNKCWRQQLVGLL